MLLFTDVSSLNDEEFSHVGKGMTAYTLYSSLGQMVLFVESGRFRPNCRISDLFCLSIDV